MKKPCWPRLNRRLGRMKPTRLAVVFLVWITACDDGGTPACTPVTVPDPVACDGAAAPKWAISGFANERADASAGATGVTVRMTQGESVRLVVRRAGDAGDGCAATVDSVAWSSSNPAVASLTPVGPSEAWLTGVAVGEAAVSARIVFKDSPPQVVAPRLYVSGLLSYADVALVRVIPAAAPSEGAIRLAHGVLSLAPHAQGQTGWSATVPFETTVKGHLDVTVDWTNPASPVDAVVGGPCPGACIIITRTSSEQTKPLHLVGPQLPPGSYNVRIDNLGLERESVSYEVWLTPGG